MSHDVLNGQTSTGIALVYGDYMRIYSGGTADSTTVNSRGRLYVSSGGTATNILENGGYVSVAAGANVSFVPNTFSCLVLSSGGATIHSGTTAVSTTVKSSGSLYVSSGGTANSTTVNGGWMVVYDGGTTNIATISEWGFLHIYRGGLANSTTVNSNGHQYIDGTANYATVNERGYLHVYSGGTAMNIIENGGYVGVADGANVTFTPNILSELVLSRAAATVHSGTTAVSTTVNYSGSLSVFSGGIANSTTVNSGGSLCISSGGTATDVVVSEGGSLELTVAPDTYIRGKSNGSAFLMEHALISGYTLNGGSLYVSSGGTANSTTLKGGKLYIFKGGAASTTIIDGGSLCVNGGTASSTTINSGGWMEVSSGGIAKRTSVYGDTAGRLTLKCGGVLHISSGGMADETIVSYRGALHISSGGTANSTTMYGGGMNVSEGGTADSITLNGGSMYVSEGGTADSITVNRGCLYASSGGTATGIVENGGYVWFDEEAYVTFTTNTFTGLILSSGQSATVHSGTTASRITVNSCGKLNIFSGGTVNSITINGKYDYFAGSTYVYRGGKVNYATINSNGNLYVESGGTANSTTVNVGGYLYVSKGGTASIVFSPWQGTVVSSAGATVKYLKRDANIYYGNWGAGVLSKYNTASALTVENGNSAIVYSAGKINKTNVEGYLIISSGGTANRTTLNGGGLHVSRGGTANRTTINNTDGRMYVDGTANRTTVNSQGYLYVDCGGIASNTTVGSGGRLCVSSGGKITGTLTLLKGARVSAYAGSILDFDISGLTASASARVNNNHSLIEGAPNFTITVSASQTSGVYTLAKGAAGFNKTITVNTNTGTKLGTITVGKTVSYKGLSCKLNLNSSALTLKVSGGIAAPAKPTVKASTTALTNKNVKLTVTYSADSARKQYSTNNKTWKTYSSAVTVSANRTYYFRGIGKAGNVSAVTSYKVSNIDKTAPSKPTIASVSTTAMTNKSVTIKAKFSSDSAKKQYSTDNKTWKNYGSGVTLKQNGTVYFRGIDKAGNISSITSKKITNICPLGDFTNDTWKAASSKKALKLSTAQKISGWVGLGDAKDFIKLEVQKAGRVSLDMNAATAKARNAGQIKLSVLNKSGKAVAVSKLDNDTLATKAKVAAGTYYLGVTCADVNKYSTSYSIKAGMLAAS